MKYSVLLDRLQKLTNQNITHAELCRVLNLKQSTMGNRQSRNSQFSDDEIEQINRHYGIDIYSGNTISVNSDSVTIDYYPDVFGSCGNGIFELSPEKTQIIIPKNAFFKNFSQNKTYSVINAHGNSMQPLIFDNDKLDNDIVSFWVKKYNKNKRDKLPVINKKYLYSVDKWNINCKDEKSKIVAINVYDFKENLIYSDAVASDWDEIIPNTYAEGYYRLFCIASYKNNPFLN